MKAAPSNNSPTFHLHSVVCGKPFIWEWEITYQYLKRKLPITKQGQPPKMSQFCVFFGGWPFVLLYSIGSLSIDFFVKSIFYHLIKSFSMLGRCSRNALIRIHSCKLPVITLLDVLRVAGNLRFVGGLLFFGIGRNSCISGNLTLFRLV